MDCFLFVYRRTHHPVNESVSQLYNTSVNEFIRKSISMPKWIVFFLYIEEFTHNK